MDMDAGDAAALPEATVYGATKTQQQLRVELVASGWVRRCGLFHRTPTALVELIAGFACAYPRFATIAGTCAWGQCTTGAVVAAAQGVEFARGGGGVGCVRGGS